MSLDVTLYTDIEEAEHAEVLAKHLFQSGFSDREDWLRTFPLLLNPHFKITVRCGSCDAFPLRWHAQNRRSLTSSVPMAVPIVVNKQGT